MTPLQAFFLGIMVSWTPGMILLAALLFHPIPDDWDEERS